MININNINKLGTAAACAAALLQTVSASDVETLENLKLRFEKIEVANISASTQATSKDDKKSAAAPKKEAAAPRAKVVIESPNRVQSQAKYNNIPGPVWVYTISFRETNGVAATMTKKRMRITCRNGDVYGDQAFESIYGVWGKVEVKLEANGTGSYTAWVNSPSGTLSGGRMHLEYQGVDEHGHPVTASVSFTLAGGGKKGGAK